MIDLGAWASEEYRVSSKEQEPSTGEKEERSSETEKEE
jgi:endogenous inhibitor of DNA gyrase (YacG/DUF329 family)